MNLFPPLPDRRELFRASLGRAIERMMAEAEAKVTRGAERRLRPPGALPEVAFLAACTRCDLCIEACPPFALRRVPVDEGLAAGTPYIDVTLQACTACPDMPCAKACPTGALTLPPEGWTGYRLAAIEFVPERCVTFKGVRCEACVEACPVGERALALDADGHPVLKAEGCVGCGVCVRACISSPSSFNHRPLEG
jgi:ferredoxin-type protein NapG